MTNGQPSPAPSRPYSALENPIKDTEWTLSFLNGNVAKSGVAPGPESASNRTYAAPSIQSGPASAMTLDRTRSTCPASESRSDAAERSQSASMPDGSMYLRPFLGNAQFLAHFDSRIASR